MNEKEAIKIFDELNQDEKLKVCKNINDFVTHNGISKGYVIHVFKWLYSVSIEEVEAVHE